MSVGYLLDILGLVRPGVTEQLRVKLDQSSKAKSLEPSGPDEDFTQHIVFATCLNNKKCHVPLTRAFQSLCRLL